MAMDDKQRYTFLTGPDGAFPLVQRTINGRQLELFDRDPRTMRDAFLVTPGHGERLAIVYGEERWTYAEQFDAVCALAEALSEDLGVRKGDFVGIAMRNYPEFVFTFWATQLIGAVAVPFNAWLRAAELGELIADARPGVVVADQERVQLLRDIDRNAVGLREVVGVRLTEPEVGVLDYGALVAGHLGRGTVPALSLSPDDPSTLLFTSGTTGKPRGVIHTHRNHSASLLNKLIRAVIVTEPTDGSPIRVDPPRPSTKLVTYPFFHIAGLNTLYTAAYAGHATIMMYKWDAEAAVQIVATEGVSELSGPPFVIQTFLASARSTSQDLTSLKMLGLGGSAAPAQLIAAIHETFGGRVVPRTGFGMTETTSGVVAISSADFVNRPTSVGHVLPTAQVKIIDEAGDEVPPGQEGQIAIAGPQVVTGYHNVPQSDSFRDGWFLTGDLGRIDSDGFVYVVGRLKDVVIRGGENINCSEVEACLSSHRDVIEAAVFGAPHPTLGEELVAIVHIAEGSTVTGEELRAYVAERLAAFKTPARVALSTADLPRTASGKIVKRNIAQALQLESLLAVAG